MENPGLNYDLGYRSYDLTVSVTDSHFTVTSLITVQVSDVNLPSTFVDVPPDNITISEHWEGPIFDLEVDDVDLSDVLTYQITVVPEADELPFDYDIFHGI